MYAKEMYTIKELAEIFKLNSRTIRKLLTFDPEDRNPNKIKARRVGPRAIRIPAKSVSEFFNREEEKCS